MRIIIAGAGDVGRQLLENLSRRDQNELVVIDSDELHCEDIAADFGALVVHGDATHPDILQKAQIDAADALVAVTDSDAINTVIAMLAHRAGVAKIIVKLTGSGLRAACQEIGVSDIIAPTIAAAAQIQAALAGAKRLDFSFVTRSGLKLIELEATGVKGKRVADLELPDGALFIAVLRRGELLIPRGKTRLEAKDILTVLVESEAVLNKVKQALGLEPS